MNIIFINLRLQQPLNQIRRYHDPLQKLIDISFQNPPVLQLHRVIMTLILQLTHIICNLPQLPLKPIHDILDLVQNRIALFKRGIQKSNVLVDSEIISDTLIFKFSQFVFDF